MIDNSQQMSDLEYLLKVYYIRNDKLLQPST